MILTYEQCINEYGSDYQLKKLIDFGKLFKINKGFYSDTKYFSELELIQVRYPKAVISMNSAFYYHSLTDVIPDQYYLATDKDAAKIANAKVKQIFLPSNLVNVGVEKMDYNGVEIKIYNKERMLIEAARNKNKMPYDYYKEIIGHYRDILFELDIQAIEEYSELFPKKRIITERLESEVF